MVSRRIDQHSLAVLEFEQVLQILASFASSALGKAAAAELRPSVEPEWIRRRAAETTEMKALLAEGTAVPLAGLDDIGPLLGQFGRAKTVFEPAQLLKIAAVLAASGRIRLFLQQLPADRFEHLRVLACRFEEFAPVVDEIHRCVEDEKTLCDRASEKLAQIRARIRQLGGRIQQRFETIVRRPDMRRALENERMVSRHGRVVVAVKARYRNRLSGIVLDRSNTGATLYIEPEELIELSNELEQARFDEQKETNAILWRLTRMVLERRHDILAVLKAMAHLDLTFAKARFSLAYDMAAPAICREPMLVLRRARHPLLLHCFSAERNVPVSDVMDEVVPIDVRLGEDFDLLLVTGPNTGGKTVMLKTVGLLVLMAQSGMHIPAHPDSRVGVYGQIFADIGDEQSIQQNLSTFSAHVGQIIRILRRTDDRTLVLLDELGAGTDPAEGAVLATAVLDRLLARGAKVVATTHLGRLKSYAYTTSRAENASVQFDVKTLRPTYEVRIGTPGSSNALAIASRLGMAKSLVNRARKLLQGDADGTSELINQVQATRADAERKRRRAQRLLDQARQLRAKARAELERLDRRHKLLAEQADNQIDKSMSQVRQLVDDFSRRMQNAPKPWRQYADELCRQIEHAAASTPLAARQAEFAQQVRKGDRVYVVPFGREAIVLRTNRKRKRFSVLLEGKQLEVPFSQVLEPGGR